MNGKALFIEDDEDDVFLIKRAWEMAAIKQPKEFLPNGKAAVEYLSQVSHDGPGECIPSVIFLDLNMPLMGGLEFLRWLREERGHREIPVVILTSSENPKDIAAAYETGANGYVVKPSTIPELVEMFECAAKFWLRFNRLAAGAG